MTDWKSVALAHGLDLTPREMDRLVDTLGTLEATIRPLAMELRAGDEPEIAVGLTEGGE